MTVWLEKHKNPGYLVWVAENIDNFIFRTALAQEIREKIRRWYYGDRNAAEGMLLLKLFQQSFSNNPILDQVAEPFWKFAAHSLAGEAMLKIVAESRNKGNTFRFKAEGQQKKTSQDQEVMGKIGAAMACIPEGAIIGKNLYSYLGYDALTNEEQEQYLASVSIEANYSLKEASLGAEQLNKAKKMMTQTNFWCPGKGAVALLMLVIGLLEIPVAIYMILQLILGGGSQALTVAYLVGNGPAWVLVGVWALLSVWIWIMVPRAWRAILGNGAWVFCIRKECVQDQAIMENIKHITDQKLKECQGVIRDVLTRYRETGQEHEMYEPLEKWLSKFLLPDVAPKSWTRRWNMPRLLNKIVKRPLGSALWSMLFSLLLLLLTVVLCVDSRTVLQIYMTLR